MLFLVRSVLRDELGDVFIDTPLVQVLIKRILDTNVKGIKLVKRNERSDHLKMEMRTWGPMYRPRRFQSASAVSSVPVFASS